MANDIKISANMDSSSFRQFNSTLVTLTSSIKVLNGELEKMARTVKTINTGGISQGAANLNVAPGKDKGGITSTLIGEGAGRVASEAKQAMNSVANDARRMADSVLGDIKRLRGSDAGWSNRANFAIQTGIGIGVPMSPDAGWSNRAYEALGHPFTPNPSAGSIAPSGAPTNPIVPSTNEGGGGGGWGINALRSIGSGGISGFLGSTLGRAGIAGAAVYAGYRVAGAVADDVRDIVGANQQYAINYPIQAEQARASAFSPQKSFARSIIGRDFLGMYGYNQAVDDPAFSKSITNLKVRQGIADLSFRNQMGVLGELKSKVFDKAEVGGAFGVLNQMTMAGGGIGAMSGIPMMSKVPVPDLYTPYGLDAKGIVSRADILKANINMSVAPEAAASLTSLVEAKKAQLSAAGEYFLGAMSGGGALGRVKSLRGAGLSTADVMVNGTPMSAYEHYQSQALGGGWDVGDLASGYQQVLGIGRGYLKTFGRTGLLSAGIEGFGNIGQIVKNAGMITGSIGEAGLYGNFVNGRGGWTGGAGGLDVSVARELFQNISQGALGTGMYGGQTLGIASAQMARYVAGGGADVAGQQRYAMAYGMGGDLERSYTSGSRSPFDKAASWQDAIYATGGTYDARTIRLQEMGATDPRMLAAIAYGGAKVPGWASELVDPTSAKAYLESSRTRSFASVVDEQWANTPQHAAALKVIRENKNDPNAYFASKLNDRSLGKVGSQKWMEAEWDAAMFAASFLGGNKVANAAKLSEQFLRTVDLDAPSGPGAHAAAPRGLEKKAIAGEIEVLRALSQYGGSLPAEERRALEEKFGAANVSKIIARAADKGDVNAAADNFVKAAGELAQAIKAARGSTPNRATPP